MKQLEVVLARIVLWIASLAFLASAIYAAYRVLGGATIDAATRVFSYLGYVSGRPYTYKDILFGIGIAIAFKALDNVVNGNAKPMKRIISGLVMIPVFAWAGYGCISGEVAMWQLIGL